MLKILSSNSQSKFKILFSIFITFIAFQSNAQIIFSEDFEGVLDDNTLLPISWTEAGNSLDGIYKVGDFNDANQTTNWPVPDHTLFAMTNDDNCGSLIDSCDKSQDRLVLPIQNFSTYSGTLNFNFSAVADINGFWGGIYTVEVSSDGGATWTNVYTMPPTDGTFEWQDLQVDLSAYLGLSEVLISFLYNDEQQWGSGMAIDDVSLEVISTGCATLAIEETSPISCLGNDGVLTATSLTDISAYSFTWSNGVTTVENAGLVPGTYTVFGTFDICTTNTATITIDLPVSPVIVDDNYSLPQDQVFQTDASNGVLSNDIYSGNVTATLVSSPLNGILTFNADGSFIFEPFFGYSGLDGFSYTIADGCGNVFTTGFVQFSVQPVIVNTPPNAVQDNATTTVNQSVDIEVLLNDSDAEDFVINPAMLGVLIDPVNGTVMVDNLTGIITYTPNTDFIGTDSFTYIICDSQNECDTTTVTIIVTENQPTNLNPIAGDDNVSTLSNQEVLINVLTNDSDPDGAIDPSSISVNNPPLNGTISIDFVTGTITYTPNAGYFGTDEFTYIVCDTAIPALCDEATVTIDIQNALPPIANDDNGGTIFVNGENGFVAVLQNDTDPNGNPFAWTGHTIDLDINTPGIQTSFQATNPDVFWEFNELFQTISCDPSTDVIGTVSLEYQLCDAQELCDNAIVSFNVIQNTASLNQLAFNLEIYPNPVSDVLNIKNSENNIKEIKILSLEGKVIKSLVYSSQINVSDLTHGLYIVHLEFVDGNSKKLNLIKK